MITRVEPSLSRSVKTHGRIRSTRLERMEDMLMAIVVISAIALLAIVLVWYASLYYGATHRGTAAQASPTMSAAPTAQDTSGTDSNASNIIAPTNKAAAADPAR